MKKVASGTTTVYIFSGTLVLAEYQNGAAPSAPTREYVYSGGALLAKIESGAVQYYHPDQLSVRLMTDSNGNVIGQEAHYPFGESWYQTSTTTKWFFTTYERDSESGNDYAMARYGINRLGRFSSPDLLAGSVGDPQSLDRYAYVRNDPVNLVDPLGLTDCDPADEEEGYCTSGGESSGDGDPYYDPVVADLEPAPGSGSGCTWDASTATLHCPTPSDPVASTDPYFYYCENYNLCGQPPPSAPGDPVGGGGGGSGGSGQSPKPQTQTQQQKKQACLNEFNNSPDGKFYNFFSPASPFIGPNKLESAVEDTAGIAAKYGGYKGLRYVADNDIALPELSPLLADSIPWLAKKVVLPVSVAATVGQVTGHVGCSIASHF